MAETNAMENKSANVGKVEVPATAEVTRVTKAQMLADAQKINIPHLDVSAQPQSQPQHKDAVQRSEATASVKGKKETYTVTAEKSIHEDGSSARISERVVTEKAGKKVYQSEERTTETRLSDDRYIQDTVTETSYKDNRSTQKTKTETRYYSSTLAESRGYADSMVTYKTSSETNRFDRKGRDRGMNVHYEISEYGESRKRDNQSTFKKDGTVADYKLAVASRYGHDDMAYVREGDSTGETFYAEMNDKRTYYKVHDKKTGKDTYVYAYSDGRVEGYISDGDTQERQYISEKKARKLMKRDAKRAEKIISSLTDKNIRTLEDYYNSVPHLSAAKQQMPLIEALDNDKSDPQYQQAAQERSMSNEQQVAESRMITADDIVAAKMQEYHQR